MSNTECSFEVGLEKPGPEVIKLFLCSTQLSLKFQLLSNVKIVRIDGIFMFKSILKPIIYPANKC